MSRILIAGTAAALAAAVLSLGGVLHPAGATQPDRPHAAADALTSGFGAGDTVRLVTQLQRARRRAVALSPSTAASYWIVGDALVELGRYRAAFAMFDTMARLKPGLPAYARISYARELRGDWSGAVQA